MKNPKLNQVLAIEKGTKTETQRTITDAHHRLQKKQLLSGISRAYNPKDDDGERLPAENQRIQLRAREVVQEISSSMADLLDITATKDWANTAASADVVVNEKTILSNVPVTYLLFLEKQLQDVMTIIKKLPTLDQSEEWEWSDELECYATKPTETHRTKKVPRVLVKYEATEEHPAQTDVWHEDVIVGYWKTQKFSSALPQNDVSHMLNRCKALLKAVKEAREDANSAEVSRQKVGKKLLDFIFEA